MRNIPVAIPTCLALPSLRHHVVDTTRLDKFLVQLRMTTDAIIHNDLCAAILSHDRLTLTACHEICHVLHAIHALEGVMRHDVAIRDVTVVAGHIPCMGRTAPCRIIGRHDMAVHAGRRIIPDQFI